MPTLRLLPAQQQEFGLALLDRDRSAIGQRRVILARDFVAFGIVEVRAWVSPVEGSQLHIRQRRAPPAPRRDHFGCRAAVLGSVALIIKAVAFPHHIGRHACHNRLDPRIAHGRHFRELRSLGMPIHPYPCRIRFGLLGHPPPRGVEKLDRRVDVLVRDTLDLGQVEREIDDRERGVALGGVARCQLSCSVLASTFASVQEQHDGMALPIRWRGEHAYHSVFLNAIDTKPLGRFRHQGRPTDLPTFL